MGGEASRANRMGNVGALLQNPAIWRGDQCARQLPGISSGFPELDAILPGGGWPQGALTEILFEQEGIGELQLVMPALARLSTAGHGLAWIAPPHVPYAPALTAFHIRLSRLLVVRPKEDRERLWAAEQALRCGVCKGVLVWADGEDGQRLRRLQVAAGEGGGWGILYRPLRAAAMPSPAVLRLSVERAGGGLRVHVLKRRGSAVAPIHLDLSLRVAS